MHLYVLVCLDYSTFVTRLTQRKMTQREKEGHKWLILCLFVLNPSLFFIATQCLKLCCCLVDTGMELVGPAQRTIAGIVIELFWSVGLFIILLLAYLIRDWHYLQIAVSCLNIPFVAHFLWGLVCFPSSSSPYVFPLLPPFPSLPLLSPAPIRHHNKNNRFKPCNWLGE